MFGVMSFVACVLCGVRAEDANAGIFILIV